MGSSTGGAPTSGCEVSGVRLVGSSSREGALLAILGQVRKAMVGEAGVMARGVQLRRKGRARRRARHSLRGVSAAGGLEGAVMSMKVGGRDRERGATITRHVRVRGSNQGSSECVELVRCCEGQGSGRAMDVDNWETSAEALRKDTPVSEIRVVVSVQVGNITRIWVGTESAKGRHDPLDTKEM